MSKIVRCQECSYYVPETLKFSDGGNGSSAYLVPFCDKLRRETESDGFCWWAESKEN